MDEISRMEKILRGDNTIEPITRLEKFCAKAAGTYTGDPLTPVTRLEWFLDQISGGGGGITLSTFISGIPSWCHAPETYGNSTYQEIDAPEGYAYDHVKYPDDSITFLANTYAKTFAYNARFQDYWIARRSTVTTVIAGHNVDQFNGSSMLNCSSLKNIVCYRSSVSALQGPNALNGTPFASGGTGGTLWVPNSLIASYQAATNWSTILGYANNQIKAIEGSEWE